VVLFEAIQFAILKLSRFELTRGDTSIHRKQNLSKGFKHAHKRCFRPLSNITIETDEVDGILTSKDSVFAVIGFATGLELNTVRV
jgi:hypothetical protein